MSRIDGAERGDLVDHADGLIPGRIAPDRLGRGDAFGSPADELAPERFATIATLTRRPWALRLDPIYDPNGTVLDEIVKAEALPLQEIPEGAANATFAQMYFRLEGAIPRGPDGAELRGDLEDALGTYLRMQEQLHIGRMAAGG